MSVTTANLKLMVQRRSAWFWYIVAIATVLPGVIAMIARPVAGKGRFAIYLIVSLMGGLLTASLTKDVLAKPFSFCLPGHDRMSRRVLFGVGIALNILLALHLLVYPGLSTARIVLTVASAAALGLTVFLLAALLILETRRGGEFIGFLPLVIFGSIFFDAHVVIEYAIVNAAIPIFILTAITSVATWPMLGGRKTQRQHCGAKTVSILDNWNLAKLRRLRRERLAEKLARRRESEGGILARTCLGRIRTSSPLSGKRYVWGTGYELFSRYRFADWVKTFVLLLVYMLVFGHMLGGRGANAVLVLSLFACEMLPLPTDRTLLMPASRRDRLLASAFAIAIWALLSVLFMGALYPLSSMAAAVLPPVKLKGVTFIYQPLDPAHLYVPALAVLVGSLLKTLLRDHLIRVLLLGGMFGLGFSALPWLTGLGPVVIATIIAGVALCLYLALRKQCLKGVLVGKA